MQSTNCMGTRFGADRAQQRIRQFQGSGAARSFPSLLKAMIRVSV